MGMPSFIEGISDEEWEEFSSERRSTAFLRACRMPSGWRLAADRHYRAANVLYDTAYAAYERNIARAIAEFPSSGTRKIEGQELLDLLDEQLLSDFLLMAGYALECMLKGYFVLLKPEQFEGIVELPRSLCKHDLCQLCAACDISLNQDESNLLTRISHNVIWGKYPSPIRALAMPSPVDPDHKLQLPSVGNLFHKRRGQALVKEVYDRFMDLFEAKRHANQKVE